ncbi:TetR family transcriptional regulator ActII [Intrasporangium mesophilum]
MTQAAGREPNAARSTPGSAARNEAGGAARNEAGRAARNATPRLPRPTLPDAELPTPPWRRPPKGARSRTPISLERIVDEALRIIDVEGTDGVTMRRVAAELGTGPASLYAYVESRDELLRLVHDRVIAEVEFPDFETMPWKEAIRVWALDVYDVYHRHGDIALLSFAEIPTGPEALRGAEEMAAALLRAGVPERVALWALDRLALYIGADAYEGWLMRRRFGGGTIEESERRGMAYFEQVGQFFASLPREQFPTIVDHVGAMMGGDGEERFLFGLDLLLDGIESRIPRVE